MTTLYREQLRTSRRLSMVLRHRPDSAERIRAGANGARLTATGPPAYLTAAS
jgi:hypothetical protein